MQYRKRRFKKDGRIVAPRGVRLTRKRKFEPTIATKSGVNVRSQYEKTCVDYLFGKNIKFQYEPLMLLAGKQYRPDFYLPDHNLFIEICGYNHFPFYTDRQSQKQEIYEKHGMKAIFIKYSGKGSLTKLLDNELKNASVL